MITFTSAQLGELLDSGYIDRKIGESEAYIDDLVIENDEGQFDGEIAKIQAELDSWVELKTALTNDRDVEVSLVKND